MNPRNVLASAAALALSLSAAPAAAQSTHVVDLLAVTFDPADITINVGDTVRWEWVVGFHNVESGVGGVADGNFSSGGPTVNDVFEVTFDAAFLAANPAPGDVYDYYCVVHLPGMIGTVSVNTSAGSVTPYGVGLNPADSLVYVNGAPSPGSTINVEVDNPADPLSGPGFAFLFAAGAPQPNFPNGLPIPGWGMTAGAAGEILINITPPDPLVSFGPATWNGSSAPAAFAVPVPNDPAFIGLTVYLQGAVFDLGNPANGIGMTNGLEVVFG